MTGQNAREPELDAWARATFPPACNAAKPCARHYARGYFDAEPCGPLSPADLAKLTEDGALVLAKYGSKEAGGSWHSVEAKCARGALVAAAQLLGDRAAQLLAAASPAASLLASNIAELPWIGVARAEPAGAGVVKLHLANGKTLRITVAELPPEGDPR